MAFDISKSAEVIQLMEDFMAFIRPKPEIRPEVDIAYEFKGNSLFLLEIRPSWNNPQQIMRLPFAKATFVQSKNIWKIYWLRANSKWYPYTPSPVVKELNDFLIIVDEDPYHCFKG